MATVVGLLVAMPLAAWLGWTHWLLRLDPSTLAIVTGEVGPHWHDAIVDPSRARFGWTVALGAVMFVAVCGRRGGWLRWLALLSILAWAILAPLLRVALWQPLGLARHNFNPSSHAALVVLDLALAGTGAVLLGVLARSWRLSLAVVLSLALVLWLGYLTRFGRGRGWALEGLGISLTVDTTFYAAVARNANAFWQPLVALVMIELGLRERRRWIERHPAGRCPKCEYPLTSSAGARCSECGWAPVPSTPGVA